MKRRQFAKLICSHIKQYQKFASFVYKYEYPDFHVDVRYYVITR